MNNEQGYQIRHKEWGVFQGDFIGLGFWHPMSEQPEQGLFRFPKAEQAREFIDHICRSGKHAKNEFTIEPFDAELSRRLQSAVAA